jgi:hypothetical protein
MLSVKPDLRSKVEIVGDSRKENTGVKFNNTCIEAASANPDAPV